MIKKIILFIIISLGLGTKLVFAEAITLASLNSNSTFVLHKIGTSQPGFLDNQYTYIEDGGYFISNGSATCFYNHLGQAISPAPFSCGAFTYLNSRYGKYQTIETERFQYFITKPYSSNTSQTSSSYKTSYVIVYDKKEDSFYQNAFTRTYSHSNAPYWFFLDGQLYFKHYGSSSRYTFNTNDEFGIGFVTTEVAGPNIQHIFISGTVSYQIKYNGSDNGSTLYSVSGNSLNGTTWIYDTDLGIVKTSSSIVFPENPLGINITRTSYQDYNCLNYKGDIMCSFYSGDHSIPTEDTFGVYSYKFDANLSTWTYYPDVYFHHYNNYYDGGSGGGWFQSKETIISDNIKFTRFGPLKVGYYSDSALDYKKTYFTADYKLETNDVLNSTVNFSFTGTTTPSDVIIDPGDITSTTTSSNLDLSDDSQSFFGDIFNSLFGVDETKINDLENSISGAVDTGTSGFSVGTGGTSGINYIPGNSDYGNIINRDDEKLTCDMFNSDGSFAYYSNGSYDLSINLNGILNLGYADKVPFLEELLFIPNKILSFITNPLNNIFSTLRVFGGIGENTYCYFGTLQTIKFQKHVIVGTSFFGGDIIFIPGTLTIIDYLIMFFLGIPLLIITVRILLY